MLGISHAHAVAVEVEERRAMLRVGMWGTVGELRVTEERHDLLTGGGLQLENLAATGGRDDRISAPLRRVSRKDERCLKSSQHDGESEVSEDDNAEDGSEKAS